MQYRTQFLVALGPPAWHDVVVGSRSLVVVSTNRMPMRPPAGPCPASASQYASTNVFARRHLGAELLAFAQHSSDARPRQGLRQNYGRMQAVAAAFATALMSRSICCCDLRTLRAPQAP
jgi:hypothetical protein